MNLRQIDFSKTFYDDQIYDCLVKNYGLLGKEWVMHQWNWMNYLYTPFKDHIKFLIIISLVEKTLQFYDQMNIDLNFDQFNSNSTLRIEKFSIAELREKLSLPKETIRRKILELEKLGILRRYKKQIILDRTIFSKDSQLKQIKITSKYINLFAQVLNKYNENKKSFSKTLTQDTIENIVKKNWSICLRWFLRMQIPLILSYNKFFKDSLTFNIFVTVVMNQVFNLYNKDRSSINYNYDIFTKRFFLEGKNSPGLSAMSISEMTTIPRATVIRKCKSLINKKFLLMNNKKQYVLSGKKIQELSPHQVEIFKNKSKFLRKMLNLIIIS